MIFWACADEFCLVWSHFLWRKIGDSAEAQQWSSNSLKIAHISIPATSVLSERVFSTSAQKSQLLPENIDMLILLKNIMTILGINHDS